MASESIITLYDSASRSGMPLAWNPMVLKARYALDFKGIPYKTVWLEYPDIEPTLRSIGAAPTRTKPDGTPHYTIPVIADPSRPTASGLPTVVSDSWLIAEYLDEAYPTPGLLLPEGSRALQMHFQQFVTSTVFLPLLPILALPLMDFLNDISRAYWREAREAYAGVKLEEMCPRGTQKWADAWTTVQKGFADVAALLDKNGSEGNTLVMGNKVSFGDFVIASCLEPIFIVFPEEWEERVRHWDNGRWAKLRDHCAALKTEGDV
ncbi:hypothetical protein JB92DRAFT_3050443 [Gautieria morchelliformis]|nr:hypothetical protein JB92DRAFT_3050443 [Gautieria morchelliformis]